MIDSLSAGLREFFNVWPRGDVRGSQVQSPCKPKERSVPAAKTSASDVELIPAKTFRRMLCQERKRSERSRKCFILMLVRAKSAAEGNASALQRVAGQLVAVIRETDILGWFETGISAGVIFNELGSADLSTASMLVVPPAGDLCRERVFDNSTWRIRNKGSVDCSEALAKAANSGADVRSPGSRLGLIAESFRGKP